MEAELFKRRFHGNYEEMADWQRSAEDDIRRPISDLAAQLASDPTRERINLPPLRRNRRVPTEQQLTEPIPNLDYDELEGNEEFGSA